MASMENKGDAGKMACCLCGCSITPNESYMCVNCLNNQVDLSEGLNLHQDVISCGKCGRWHITGNQWKFMEDESPQLLSHLVKKVGLEKNRCKVLDAMFVWTEPHSKRLKVAVTFEKEVFDDKVRLSKRVVAEFVLKMKQCIECIREATDHTWGSCVQIRQKVSHKRGFDKLEELLIAKGLQNLMLDVKITKDGSFDLYFKSKNQGDRVIEVISSAMPIRKKESKKLVSTDKRNQTAKMEYTTVLEVVPINKDDLVLLKKAFTGGKPELFLCSKVSSNLHLVSPGSLQKVEISASKYYQTPFHAMFSSRDLEKYIVLDISALEQPYKKDEDSENTSLSVLSSIEGNTKFCLAEAEVVRDSSSGGAEDIVTVITHLGHVLKPGDTALGYNLATSHVDDEILASLPYALPECILVMKSTTSKVGERKKKKPKTKTKTQGKGSDDEEVESVEDPGKELGADGQLHNLKGESIYDEASWVIEDSVSDTDDEG